MGRTHRGRQRRAPRRDRGLDLGSTPASWLRPLTLEQGKPRSEAAGRGRCRRKAFDYYAAEAVRVRGETIPTACADTAQRHDQAARRG